MACKTFDKDAWQEKQDAVRALQNAASARANAAAGMPPLVGTEKQVAWAEGIREWMLKQRGNSAASLPQPTEQQTAEAAARLGVTVDALVARVAAATKAGEEAELRLRTEASASFFIENKGTSYVHDAIGKAMKAA
jgi:hypothetical protein